MILNKRGAGKIHVVVPTKYHKYPSTTILEHANILAKGNKSPHVLLLYMMPHDAYSIKIHVLKMTIEKISHEQTE